MRPGYDWIPDHPLPPPRRGKHRRYDGRPWTDANCPRCGHGPFAWHKWCPACRHPRPDPEAGHLGALEQYLWVVFLLVFFVLTVRLVGVAW